MASSNPPETSKTPPLTPRDPSGAPRASQGPVFSSFNQKLAGNPAPRHKVVEVLDSLLTFGHGDAAGLLTHPGRLSTPLQSISGPHETPWDPSIPSPEPPSTPPEEFSALCSTLQLLFQDPPGRFHDPQSPAQSLQTSPRSFSCLLISTSVGLGGIREA